MMRKKQVVVIGGGRGQAILLRGLKHIDDIHLTSLVTVADDGGSTGRLRQMYAIPAMGDIRDVMIAMAKSETLLSRLMGYRFKELETSELGGHNLGNLILTAMMENSGNFMESIGTISKVLNVKGDIVPSTLQVVTLYARMIDGTIVKGEDNIPTKRNRISEVFYQNEVRASEQAIQAIERADYIIYGIGSLYTSICPNLIIKDIQEALKRSKAKIVYVCNAMSETGETDGYYVEDHVEALRQHSLSDVNLVVVADDKIPENITTRYLEQETHRVLLRDMDHSYEVVKAQLLDFDEGLVTHNSIKVANILNELLFKE
jgi:uncharacterized cofD-like protein